MHGSTKTLKGAPSKSLAESEFKAWWRYRFQWLPSELVEVAIEGELERRNKGGENFWLVGDAEDVPPEIISHYEPTSYEPFFNV